MFRYGTEPSGTPRRGVILLVVVSLLTLFAIIGLSFVLYADSVAKSSQTAREIEAPSLVDVDPEHLLNYFLGQLLYDAADDETGVYSAMRGHSLARSMYGYNYTVAPPNSSMPPAGTLIPGDNSVPFNGTGRLQSPGTNFGSFTANGYDLVNYTFYRRYRLGDTGTLLTDGFLRDPERLGFRAGLDPHSLAATPFAGGFNVPYTYPDLNNMFLAAVRASDGAVLMPSFYRPWNGFTPGAGQTGLEPDNLNWRNPDPSLKYRILRPRPAENPGFPLPEDAGGDVKNLVDSPGTLLPDGRIANNDSIWMDLGHPVLLGPDGRKFKPLFAALILDLDNRVNVSVHGNIRGRDINGNPVHVSNQGWGPWEVNLAKVLNAPNAPGEWTNLFTANPTLTPFLGRFGRYGLNGLPSAPPGNVARSPAPGRFYSIYDFDGCDNLTLTTRFNVTGAAPHSCFPSPTQAGYNSGQLAPVDELTNHPSLYNVFTPNGDDRLFRLSDLEGLLRYGDTNAPGLTSDLFRLCPNNFANPRIRRLVTTRSFDVDRPGMTPWFNLTSAPPTSYDLQPDPEGRPYVEFPRGDGFDFPATPGTAGGEFGLDGRAVSYAQIGRLFERLDLNRPLPDYPAPDPATFRVVDDVGFRVAQAARQQLATDIFNRLRAVTGTAPPIADFNVLRWLAQLAVNIVDFIDNDDYMTPFNWDAPGIDRPPFHATAPGSNWVFGTELPRVVINEAFVWSTDPPNMGAPRPHHVWVELYNPFNDDANVREAGVARLELPAAGAEPAFGAYRIIICRPPPPAMPGAVAAELRRRDNVTGTPEAAFIAAQPGGAPAIVSTFGPPAAPIDPTVILPSNGQDAAPAAPAGPDNRGYYVLGPERAPRPFPNVNVTRLREELTYEEVDLVPPTVVLQRLACPNRRPQPTPDPVTGEYNPYITVDFLTDIHVNSGPEGDDPSGPSVERLHPYSDLNRIPIAGKTPPHTFYRINLRDPATTFTWLVHLDRVLRTPLELIHVSAFKPHELTQEFNRSVITPGSLEHRAPWFDEGAPAGQSRRLYRLFEFLTTRSWAQGLSATTTTSTTPITRPGGVPPGQPFQAIVAPAQMRGATLSGTPVSIQPGSVLRILPTPGAPATERAENVRVISVSATTFTAEFISEHSPGPNNEPYTIEVTSTGDRIPGKININTVWDVDTFRAICDAQPPGATPPGPHVFTDDPAAPPGSVQHFFRELLDRRTADATNRIPGPTDTNTRPNFNRIDRPFRGLAVGLTSPSQQYPLGVGIGDTLLQPDPNRSGQRLLEVGTTDNHLYERFDLLTKILGQLTTRSNVFAVWLTVGFFEVTDDTVLPVRLGAEIGRAENRHVRHRMFAIVDRTNLIQQQVAVDDLSVLPESRILPAGFVPSPVARLATAVTGTPAPNIPSPQSFQLSQTSGVVPELIAGTVDAPLIWRNVPWSVTGPLPPVQTATVPGSVLKVGDEIVVVTSRNADSTVFQARFRQDHPVGTPVQVLFVPGNPGPQPRFDHRNCPAIVRYVSIIQ